MSSSPALFAPEPLVGVVNGHTDESHRPENQNPPSVSSIIDSDPSDATSGDDTRESSHHNTCQAPPPSPPDICVVDSDDDEEGSAKEKSSKKKNCCCCVPAESCVTFKKRHPMLAAFVSRRFRHFMRFLYMCALMIVNSVTTFTFISKNKNASITFGIMWCVVLVCIPIHIFVGWRTLDEEAKLYESGQPYFLWFSYFAKKKVIGLKKGDDENEDYFAIEGKDGKDTNMSSSSAASNSDGGQGGGLSRVVSTNDEGYEMMPVVEKEENSKQKTRRSTNATPTTNVTTVMIVDGAAVSSLAPEEDPKHPLNRFTRRRSTQTLIAVWACCVLSAVAGAGVYYLVMAWAKDESIRMKNYAYSRFIACVFMFFTGKWCIYMMMNVKRMADEEDAYRAKLIRKRKRVFELQQRQQQNACASNVPTVVDEGANTN